MMRGMTPSNVLRRSWSLVEPGDALMIPTSPIDMAIDAGEFLEFAQLHGGQVVVTPLVALPIPRYDTDGVPAFEREAIPTEALWHPWFWIPTEMARRRDGETDDEWAMRIAIESSGGGRPSAAPCVR